MTRWIDRWAASAVERALSGLTHGRLRLETPLGKKTFGAPGGIDASMRVRDSRVFRRLLTDGEIGLGESYMDGDWSSPDLVALARLMLRNRDAMTLPSSLSWLGTLRDRLMHRLQDNTVAGSRRNISRHYDLGNDFYRLFLDDLLLYSCAFYERSDLTLEAAQTRKLKLLCDKLSLRPGDRLLEIGTGWGGLALYAASCYGCHVTTTTISERQYAHTRALIAKAGAESLVDLRREDYRQLEGQFDKIVSVEMFEAVGYRHYDTFFRACDRLLVPGGLLLLQTITVDDWRFHDYRRSANWISKHVFPGGELASVAEVLNSAARTTRLGLHHVQQIGTHYARTLHAWRERFHRRLPDVAALGFDSRFVRTWDLYLAYCEAAFLERHIGDVQLLMAKAGGCQVMFDEPWSNERMPHAIAV